MPEEFESFSPFQVDELLFTKQIPPRLNNSLIARSRLLAWLDDGLGKRLSVISAPTGFGKTTLVSQWLARLDMPGKAWVTLDAGDNDPVRFWRYIIGALQQASAEIGRKSLSILRSSKVPSFDQLVISLINDLLKWDGAFILVLDEAHEIRDPAVIETIQYFLEHQPPNLHLVLIGRSEPNLSLALLRARGEIQALGANDLRFSPSEIADFLKRTLPFDPSGELIERFERKTEGWPAGIRLVTSAMRSRNGAEPSAANPDQSPDDTAVEPFSESMNGDHRYVTSYLHREVFEQLPDPLRRFILHTCLLERLTAPLCDWVLSGGPSGQAGSGEQNQSAEILAALEQDALFLVALGNSQGYAWFRYQSLFAEAMRYEARRSLGDGAIRAIHQSASRWLKDHGFLEEAISAALAAQDYEHALAWMEDFIRLRRFNEILILRRWCDPIALDRICQNPLVAFSYAQALLFSSDRYASATAEKIAPLLDAVEARWRAQKNFAGLGQLFTVKSIINWWQGDLKGSFHYAHQAMELLAESDALWRGVALLTLGNQAYLDGSFSEARNRLLEAQAFSGAANNIHSVLAARSLLGDIAYQEGAMDQATLHFRQVFDRAVGGEEMLDDQSISWLGLARIAYESNNLQTALDDTNQALDLSMRRSNEAVWGPAASLKAMITGLLGDVSLAMENLEALLPRVRLPHSAQEIWATLCRLALHANDLVSARSWHSLIAAEPESAFLSERVQAGLLAARWMLADNKPEQALDILKTCQIHSQRQGSLRNSIETYLLQAQALDALGNRPQAIQALTVALTQAQPREFRRIFLDEGRPIERLLAEISNVHLSRNLGNYATALLHLFPAQNGPSSGPQAKQAASRPAHAILVEPLSAQELRVIRLLAAGRTNPEIAEALTVSVNTVKTQVQSIYRKLNVNSRREACDAAREFHLI